MSDALLLVIAAGLCAGGIALLRRAWAGGGIGEAMPLWMAGWSGIAASIVLWGAGVSPDEGAALGVAFFILCGLVAVGLGALGGGIAKRPGRVMREGTDIPHTPGRPLRILLAFLVIGPGTGLASLSLSVFAFALLDAMGAEITAALTAAFFLFPLLWGVLAVSAAMETRAGIRAGAIFCAALVPAAAVMLTG